MSHPALTRIDGRFWRCLFAAEAGRLMEGVHSPEGRSHHGGQSAIYLSQTPLGCAIAVARYLRPGEAERRVYPLHVTSDRIVDLRDRAAVAALGIDTTHRAVEWQSWRARGARPPTWDISDRVRALGLHGMLYASRSRPTLTHLTLFDWGPTGAVLRPDGAPVALPDPG